MSWLILGLFIIYLAFSNKNINLNSAEDFIKDISELFFSIVGFFTILVLCLIFFI